MELALLARSVPDGWMCAREWGTVQRRGLWYTVEAESTPVPEARENVPGVMPETAPDA
jgi:hypothetical protein